MEKHTGREHQEIWGISPISHGSVSRRSENRGLFRKVMAGSCMGVVCGVLLTFLAEEPAHAELHDALHLGSMPGADAFGEAGYDPTERMSREELVLHAGMVDDYRFRIPAWSKPEHRTQSLQVTATAYNNVPEQTDSTPDIAAWGDRIQPGMPLIAVSRDLVKKGLKRGTRVRIAGIDGEFVVLDKMNKRFKKRIDIYMGKDIQAAREFGRQKVIISWTHNDLVEIGTLIASR